MTAYLELVPEAYRTEHRYTLAKPIKASELDSALERAMAGIEQADEWKVAFRGKSAKRSGGSSVFSDRSLTEHGWGLRIVQDICARCEGELSLESEGDGKVTATAVLSCVGFGER